MSEYPEIFLVDAPKIPLPESPPQDVALPHTPAEDIGLPDSTSSTPKTRAKNPFADHTPEEHEYILSRIAYLSAQNRGASTAFTSATETPLPASPERVSLPNGLRNRKTALCNSYGKETSGINGPPLPKKYTLNIQKEFKSNGKTTPPNNTSSSTLSTASSSDEEPIRGRTRIHSNASRYPTIAPAQNVVIRPRPVIRVPLADLEREVVVLSLPMIIALLILAIVALMGVLVGAGVVYYLTD